MNKCNEKQLEAVDEGYSIGLDIGTHSLGWSVTDQKGKLLKKKKHNLLGVVMFSEGQSAAQRRVYRSTRRRMGRRKQRIHWLQEIFEEAIVKQDPKFFGYLEQSFYHLNDEVYSVKRSQKYNLFNDVKFTDVNYYEAFNTIYDLRKQLMMSEDKVDIRLVYLAIHHIMKYRGNFLYEGQSFSSIVSSIGESLDGFAQAVNDVFEESFEFENITKTIQILEDKSISKSDKAKSLASTVITQMDKKRVEELFKGMVGLQCNLSKIFVNQTLEKEGKEIKLKINSEDFVNEQEFVENTLGDDFLVVDCLMKLHSWYELHEILGGEQTISQAMINKYEKHRKDLKLLKKAYRKLENTEYQKMFSNKFMSKGSYACFIHNPKKCPQSELYKKIKKDLVSLDDQIVSAILKEIELDNFLPRINSTSNGSIPYQLHGKELKTILSKQGKHYAFLEQEMDKIIKIFEYRIPYYVGPLNEHSPFAWLKRKSEGKIQPWNFEEKVDIEASAEAFITNLTNYCTYLHNEEVLPRNSLLYSEYALLNELNKVRIYGKLIDNQTKQYLIEHLFKTQKTVSCKDIAKKLAEKGYPKKGNTYEISGYQGEKGFLNTLASYYDMKNIFGEINASNIKDIEKIILWMTIYEDKKILERRMKKEFPQYDQYIGKLIKKKYSGWGRLSKKLLDGIQFDYKEEKRTIIEILRNSDLNFMQIINHKDLDFEKVIIENNQGEIVTLDEKIEVLPGSPAIKKSIRIICKVVAEVSHLMKEPPKHIFIEFARSDEDSKRTKTREAELQDLYKSVTKNSEIFDVKNDLKQEDQASLQDLRRYLYYKQGGRCLYSMERLDIDNLSNYQIDHILPQALVKDDSIENKALVLQRYNQEKGDFKVPLDVAPKTYQIKQYWKYLYDVKLIGPKKYANLNANVLDIEKRFINRQLVETRQIVKHVTNLLKEEYEEAKIFAIKAKLNSDFRELFDIPKCREVNDYHHAHDAYITSVVGNYTLKKYPKWESEILYESYQKYKTEFSKKQSNKNRNGFIASSMQRRQEDENGEIIWDPNEDIPYIMKVIDYRDCYFNHVVEENSGEFYDQNASKKGEKRMIPIKKGLDSAKYGGYSGENAAYSMLVYYDDKGKTKHGIFKVSIMDAQRIKNKQMDVLETILKDDRLLKAKNVKVAKKLLKYQLVEMGNSSIYVTSASEWINAKQLKLTIDQMRKFELLLNYHTLDGQIKIAKKKINMDQLTIELFELLLHKVEKEYVIYDSLITKIKGQSAKFNHLILKDRISVIMKLLDLTKRGNSQLDFREIGLPAGQQGRICMKTKLEDNSIIIYSSITGIYVKKFKV